MHVSVTVTSRAWIRFRIEHRIVLEHVVASAACLAWAVTGLAKVASPAKLVIWHHEVGESWSVGLGLVELILGVGWLFPAARRVAGVLTMCGATAFAAAFLFGLVDTERCACFGSLRVSRAWHLFIIGLLLAISCVGVSMVPCSGLGRSRDTR
jgi:hypothetical protein